jgi:integrase
MPLTDNKIRTTKAASTTLKLSDGRGLHLEVSPAGGKWWRYRYRFARIPKQLSLGTYPEVSLKEARERLDEARKLLAAGVDPSAHRKAMKAAKETDASNSFEVVAREWFTKYSEAEEWSDTHKKRTLRLFERDIFPKMGSRTVSEVTALELLAIARKIESRGALETAHRAIGTCGQVFRYAVATGRATRDPSGDLRGALPQATSTHFAATTEPAQLGAILRAIDGYGGSPAVVCAIRLAPLVFTRPGELRRAEWKDFDLDAAEWRYTVSKTKTPHIVPLSRQAVELLRGLHPITGDGRFVFPGARTDKRPMSDNAILAAMRRMGVEKDEMTGHGFRAVARTILDEVLGVRVDYIEHQLAHVVKDANGRAYNRTHHLAERRKMMQLWADHLDTLKAAKPKSISSDRKSKEVR